ncbi:DUF4062 domain-containing protein [Nocardia sp. NBC_00403]|uniref:WD40 domain-containing protein n=1 Tax=Nocardia sp. NBC_00403 TaxID=2975990 RepID=UPI002E203D77
MRIRAGGSVFLSHTSDMAGYPADRSFVQVAIDAVLKAGLRPVDMSHFAASSDVPAEYCERRVRECDVYLGLIGFRYGSRVPGTAEDLSYTELEFAAATRARIPRIIFVLHEDAPIPVRLLDRDRDDIDAFRYRLQHAGLIVRKFESAQDLGAAVLHALFERQNEQQAADDVSGFPSVAARRPWMAPPLDRMVERPELGGWLIDALCAPSPVDVGLTTGLRGAGGFGKTMLANWVSHQAEIKQRYPGGLLWVALGQEVHGADLAERINDIAYLLDGKRPSISEPDIAGAELGRLLDQRPPVLIIVDDVWEESQLRPFRYGGRECTRLVTTRMPDILPSRCVSIPVDEMSTAQAGELVGSGVDGLPPLIIDGLIRASGRWPVLLNLINGALRHRVSRGESPQHAAADVLALLAKQGPSALDTARSTERARAIEATMNASLRLLDHEDLGRYLDLAIFPEDVEIPIPVLEMLWPGRRGDALCGELVNLGLVADYRLDPPGPRLIIHDVIRAYLRAHRSPTELRDAHARLIIAVRARLLPSEETPPTPWWLLPAEDSYLWRFVPYHLAEAHLIDELAALVCDLRWTEAKTRLLGSVIGAAADVALVDSGVANVLHNVLNRSSRLLEPIPPPTTLGATLASRVHGMPELATVLDRYLPSLPAPRLEPRWLLPDRVTFEDTTSAAVGAVTSCAFSPDGVLLATACGDGTIRFWCTADGSLNSILPGHAGEIFYCVFAPNGRLVAAASTDGRVWLWELATRTLWTVLVHAEWVTSCEFSPDGRLIATSSDDGVVRLWSVADGTLSGTLTGHIGRVTDCTFSPDGTRIATTGFDTTVRLWEVATGRLELVLRGHRNNVWGCAFSPDGTLLATTGHDSTVRLWRCADGTESAVLIGPDMWMRKCAFSPDGTLLVAAAGNGAVPLWRVSDHTEYGTMTGHTDWVRECHFSPDGNLVATTGFDGTVRLWQVADCTAQLVLGGSSTRVNGCAISPDGKTLAAVGNDQTARLYEVSSGRELATLRGHVDWVRDCAFAPDGSLVATVGSDGVARLWEVDSGAEWATLHGHSDRIRRCTFSPDGRLLATASSDRTVRLWDVDARRAVKVLTGHQEWVESCAFSPDGNLLVTTGFDMKARVWRAPDWTEVAVLSGHTDSVTHCAVSPDGALLATASDDQTTRIWRIATGAGETVLEGHTGWVENCAFSPDGGLLATVSSDQTIRLWDLATGKCHCALRLAAPLLGVAWHPDGTRLCAVGDAGIYLLTYRR